MHPIKAYLIILACCALSAPLNAQQYYPGKITLLTGRNRFIKFEDEGTIYYTEKVFPVNDFSQKQGPRFSVGYEFWRLRLEYRYGKDFVNGLQSGTLATKIYALLISFRV